MNSLQLNLQIPRPKIKHGNALLCRKENQNMYSDMEFSQHPTYNHESSKASSVITIESKMNTHLSTAVISDLKKDIIGEGYVFPTPFGNRKCVYLDQTASGKSVKSIEDFIVQTVLPVYANTHTTTSFCASQVSAFRNESRKIVHDSCGGGPEDVVIFCGSGATAAVHKVVHSLVKPGEPAPIVLIGPFEHHSNILPWREVAKQTINIPENAYGQLDMQFLEKTLQKLKSKKVFKKRVVIGAFSAASNVTGVLIDDVAVTILMHKYGGLSVWDYAAAAPHVKIEMNPKTGDKNLDQLAEKDALFFSGHKFTGGPQTTGILMAKKSIFRNSVPHAAGGGTVLFVTGKRHQYLSEIVEREEGGTPDIICSIRLGMVFQLQNTIGLPSIIECEGNFTTRVLDAWKDVPEITILGCHRMPRIPIVSIMIKHLQSGYFLHHDFVVALLNDLFGIQSRGGCMCAGPYAQRLLGINDILAMAYEKILSEPRPDIRKPVYFLKEEFTYDMILKPGFVRLSLPFHATEEEIDYTIKAVQFIATHGFKLLPFYRMDVEKGTFRFAQTEFQNQMMTTKEVNSFRLQSYQTRTSRTESHLSFDECLQFAQDLIHNAEYIIMRNHVIEEIEVFSPERMPFRWFLLPFEALQSWRHRIPPIWAEPNSCPFTPKDNYESITDDKHRWSPGSIPHLISSIWYNSSLQRNENSLSCDMLLKPFGNLDMMDEGKKLYMKDLESEASSDSGIYNDDTHPNYNFY